MSTVAGYRKVFGDFLLTCTLKNRPSVGSPPGVASGLLFSAGSTAEKHRCGGNGLVLKKVDEVNPAYVGAITRLKTAHPAAKKGRQPLFLQPQWYGADVR